MKLILALFVGVLAASGAVHASESVHAPVGAVSDVKFHTIRLDGGAAVDLASWTNAAGEHCERVVTGTKSVRSGTGPDEQTVTSVSMDTVCRPRLSDVPKAPPSCESIDVGSQHTLSCVTPDPDQLADPVYLHAVLWSPSGKGRTYRDFTVGTTIGREIPVQVLTQGEEQSTTGYTILLTPLSSTLIRVRFHLEDGEAKVDYLGTAKADAGRHAHIDMGKGYALDLTLKSDFGKLAEGK